ncbi:hypothetical protein Tco_1215318 [Tanacetum coccineum]
MGIGGVVGSIGTSSEHSVDPESEISSVPPEVYVSTPITSNEKGVSDPKSKEGKRTRGEVTLTKKKCFVCGSLSHLIKDCDYYEKKMAREAEVKKQRVFNTGNGVAKPVWTNANRVNHSNKFVPRSVQLNAGRPNINSVRPNINTGRTNINSVRPNINTGRTNVNPVRPRVNTGSSNVNTVRSRQPVPNKTSNSFSPKRPQDHPLKNMVDRGIFDSGCSGHMTGNKDQLEDFEEFNGGGSVTFGGSKDGVDIDYLTDSMNYIHTSLENQANPHAGASEVTNSADSVSRKSSTNSKKEEILKELQQEKKATSTDTSEDNPKILAFRRELEEIALSIRNLPIEIEVSPTPTIRIHNIHLKSQILSDPKSAVQTRSKENLKIFLKLYKMTWVQAMQEELLQFKLQQSMRLFESTSWNEVFEALMKSKLSDEFYGKLTFSRLQSTQQGNESSISGQANHIWAYGIPREIHLDLEAFSDSDYGGLTLNRKSTTVLFNFLDKDLNSWQCRNRP